MPCLTPQYNRSNSHETMNGLYRNENYDASSRSPRTSNHQTQSLHRQASRPVEAFGQPQNGLYTIDDVSTRYDPPRFSERINSTLPTGYSGYDMGMSPAWNSTGYAQNNNFAALGASSRLKSSVRGRSNLPSVSSDPRIFGVFTIV